MSRSLRSCDHRYKRNTSNITQQILVSRGRAFQSSVERWRVHPAQGHEQRAPAEHSALHTLMLLTCRNQGRAVTQSTAALPCSCTAPELGCQSSVLCSTNPVLQWLNHVSLQIVLDKSQKTNEGDENSQINTRVQKWNYSSKMAFPVRPLAWNSLHFHGTTTGTNKLIDIWQNYTTTMHSCSVVFFLQYWL